MKQNNATGIVATAFNANGALHPIVGATAPPKNIPNATPNGTHT
jgi:hypothetical protein